MEEIIITVLTALSTTLVTIGVLGYAAIKKFVEKTENKIDDAILKIVDGIIGEVKKK